MGIVIAVYLYGLGMFFQGFPWTEKVGEGTPVYLEGATPAWDGFHDCHVE